MTVNKANFQFINKQDSAMIILITITILLQETGVKEISQFSINFFRNACE